MMTVEQAAQSLGVSAETLIQEVIAKQMVGGILLTALFVAVLIGAIVATVKLARDVTYCDIAPIAFTAACVVLLGVVLSCNKLIDWCAAPETTAREYIMENYGGGRR